MEERSSFYPVASKPLTQVSANSLLKQSNFNELKQNDKILFFVKDTYFGRRDQDLQDT